MSFSLRFSFLEQTEISAVIILAERVQWWEKVDVSKLSEDVRYRILKYIVEKYGRKKVLEEVGIGRITLWRLVERNLRLS